MDDKATTDMYISVADPNPPSPLPTPFFLDQTEARREYLRVWMIAAPPPLPPSPHPLSQGPDPTLHFVAFNLSSLGNTILPLLQTSLFFLLISYADRLSASLTRDLGTRLFSNYFLFLSIFYWFNIFFFGYLLYPFYFWDHSLNWAICQHIIAWAQNIFKVVYS